ncbi:hypothetical protein BH10ACT1_BH10ACT1_03310 [soil metagenome]
MGSACEVIFQHGHEPGRRMDRTVHGDGSGPTSEGPGRRGICCEVLWVGYLFALTRAPPARRRPRAFQEICKADRAPADGARPEGAARHGLQCCRRITERGPKSCRPGIEHRMDDVPLGRGRSEPPSQLTGAVRFLRQDFEMLEEPALDLAQLELVQPRAGTVAGAVQDEWRTVTCDHLAPSPCGQPTPTRRGPWSRPRTCNEIDIVGGGQRPGPSRPEQRWQEQHTRTAAARASPGSSAATRTRRRQHVHLTHRPKAQQEKGGAVVSWGARRRWIQPKSGGAPTSSAHQCSAGSYIQPRTTAGGATACR